MIIHLLRCDHHHVCWMVHGHDKCINDTASDIPCCFDTRLYSTTTTDQDKVLDRLDKEIKIRENEMNRKGGLEENLVTVSGYYASAGALNWVRVVLIDGLRSTPAPEDKFRCKQCGQFSEECECEESPAPEQL